MKMALTRFITASVALSALACVAHTTRQPLAYAPRADIQISSSPNTSVLIYSNTPTQFAVRGQELRARSDTIHTFTPVQLEAYLDAGEIHVVADPAARLDVEATIAHSPATHATASGHHIILEAGGSGIRSVP